MSRYKANTDEIQKTKDDMQTSGSKNYMKFKEGKNLLRILGPYSKAGVFFQRAGTHKAKKDGPRVTCFNFTWGEDCAVCKKQSKVVKAQGKDAAKKYAPEKKVLFNVIDLNDKANVKLLDAGSTIANKIFEALEDFGEDEILDFEGGRTIIVRREGTGLNTKYSVSAGKQYNLLNDFEEEWIYENMYALHEIPFRSEEDKVLDVLDELNSIQEDDEDEDEKPKKRRPVDDDDDEPAPKKSAKKPADDDDDEPAPKKAAKKAPVDDDEDEEPAPKKAAKKAPVEDDEEEEPAPKKTAAKKAAPVDEEEEEEEPAPKKAAKKAAPVDEEEEEEPAPKKKAAVKKQIEDEDEEEAEAPKKNPKPAAKAAKKAAPADEEEEEEEEAPKKKSAKSKVVEEDDEEYEYVPSQFAEADEIPF